MAIAIAIAWAIESDIKGNIKPFIKRVSQGRFELELMV